MHLGRKQFILLVKSLISEQSEGNNYTSKINFFFYKWVMKWILLPRAGQTIHGEKRTQLSCARDEAELCPYENVRLDIAQLRPRVARICERISLLRAGHTPFGRSRALCGQMQASSERNTTVPTHSSASC